MNRIDLTAKGGHPFVKDTLKFINDRVIALSAAYGSFPTMAILSGCEVSQGATYWEVTEGYVIIFGQAYKVNAHATNLPIASSSSLLYWNIQETLTTPSPRTYKNLTVKNLHYLVEAKLSSVASFSPLSATLKYEQVIANKIVALNSVQTMNLASPFSGSFNYYKDGFNRVWLEGAINTLAIVINPLEVLGTLPVGYRPAVDTNLVVVESLAGTMGTIRRLEVLTTGDMRFTKTINGVAVAFDLDGLSFRI